MKRCTEWRGEHAAVFDNTVNYIDRLARYEDAGYEPEELSALAAPHGDLVDRNSLLASLYLLRKNIRQSHPGADEMHIAEQMLLVVLNAIAAGKSLPAILLSNEGELQDDRSL